MKRQRLSVVATLLAALFIGFGATSCDNSNNPEPNRKYFNVNDSGYSNFDPDQLREQLNQYPKEPLTANEEASLLFMREEEKLARDVYDYFYGLYTKQVFDNISESEQTHTDAVLQLIERYEVTDPAAGLAAGVFTNQVLQGLYDSLTVAGQAGLVSALGIGAVIEEIDIVDLETWEEKIDNQDILMVYGNLKKGSRNHLRAFVRNLTQMGETYSPQVLDQAAYDAIINSDIERGN